MPDTAAPAKPVKPDEGAEPGGWDVMDTLGLIAGALLIVIVIDIVSDGRLISRRLRKPQAQPEPEPVPND